MPRRFDVFLSYSSRDQAAVERIAEKLARAGLAPWFDKWCLTPGGRWQEEIADGLGASSACAVFIGPTDVGDWAREEVAVELDRAAKQRSFRVFLVLLPGLPDPFEPTALSPFLSTRTCSRRSFQLDSDEDLDKAWPGGAVAFSSDGKTLSSGGSDGTVRFWDIPSRRLLADPLPAHSGGVTGLAFTPDGTVLASAGREGTIRLFDVSERRTLGDAMRAHDLHGTVASAVGQSYTQGARQHQGFRTRLRGSPSATTDGRSRQRGVDGRVVLWDSTLWSPSYAAWRTRVCDLVRRSLTLSEWNEFLPDEPRRRTCPA